MNDGVWASFVLTDSTLLRSFSSEMADRATSHTIELIERNQRGDPLTPQCFPDSLYALRPEETAGPLPPFFSAGGLYVVSEAFVDCLEQFDIGRTAFYPVTLLEADRKTPVDGSFFLLNLCEFKETVVLDGDGGAALADPGRDLWNIIGFAQDDAIAVSQEALKGPDIWYEREVWYAIFMSGRLVEALKGAGIDAQLNLYRCRVAS